MMYNLSLPLDAENARGRLESLIKKGAVIELTKKDSKRSLPQNAYLHLIIGYFAIQTGNTREYVKEEYYKKECNSEIFSIKMYDEVLQRTVNVTKSSAELTEEEMSLSIDRFRNWALSVAGIYLPDATRPEMLAAMQVEVERYKQYI